MARILHNNRVKFSKDFFSIVLYTNMAAMTSSENHLEIPTRCMVYAGPQPAWQAFEIEREGEGNQDSRLVNLYNIFKNKPIMYVLRGA